MMSGEVSEWMERVWRVLAELPGSPEVVATQRRRWDELSASDDLRVVLFGAYDAGKSTLLKRLLVEAGTAVPEWLTISGRRETFEVKQVRSNEIVFVDTPGLGTGNAEHDQITLDALKLADAYLWVLPPQLITTGKEIFLDLLSGRSLGNIFSGTVLTQSTVAAVARMDEAGIDPADSPEGYEELARRKVEELYSMLRSGSVETELRAVHCVAADPYQMVGNAPAPNRDLYEAGWSWDGVGALRRSLEDLLAGRRQLREFAGARFVAFLAREVLEQLHDMISELELTLEGCLNEIDRHQLYEKRLEPLRRKVAAELHRRIEDELLSASRAGFECLADTVRSLEESLSRVVDEWSESSFADYRRLVADLELEIRERMTGPSLAGFCRLAEEAEDAEAMGKRPKIDPVKTGKKVLGFGPALRNAFDTFANAELGMSLKTAAERLGKLESSGETVEAFIKARGRRSTFRGRSHAHKASRFVKWGRILDAVGPLVEQLGGALFEAADEMMTARRAEQRAQQRLELREQLRQQAEKIESEAAADFDAACSGLREWIRERASTLEEGRLGLAQRIETLRNSVRTLDEALQR